MKMEKYINKKTEGKSAIPIRAYGDYLIYLPFRIFLYLNLITFIGHLRKNFGRIINRLY